MLSASWGLSAASGHLHSLAHGPSIFQEAALPAPLTACRWLEDALCFKGPHNGQACQGPCVVKAGITACPQEWGDLIVTGSGVKVYVLLGLAATCRCSVGRLALLGRRVTRTWRFSFPTLLSLDWTPAHHDDPCRSLALSCDSAVITELGQPE